MAAFRDMQADWDRLEPIYHDALSRPREERATFLDAACAGNRCLRDEIEELLRCADVSALDVPPTITIVGTDARVLTPGTRLGPYAIESHIASGGMGEVYRARDTRLARAVAIKVIRPEVARDREQRERFQREAHAISALAHPHICTLYDVGTADGIDYLVMECLEGESLASRLEHGSLAFATVLTLGDQIADALEAAHSRSIIHRDLKPANIFLTTRGDAKVLDFGLAKLETGRGVRLDAPTGAADLETVTRAGTTLGTIAYMSPEQLRGEPLDSRTDLFSLGLVLYAMATGAPPFGRSSASAVVEAILNRTPDPTSRLRPEVPPAFDALMTKALEKDRAARYQHARDIQHDLRQLAAADAVRRDRRTAKLRAVAVALAALLVAAIVGGAALWRSKARERWALAVAAPEAARLIDADRYVDAAALLREARAIVPGNRTLEKLWTGATDQVSIRTDPAAADVAIRAHDADPDAWQPIGRTPLANIRVARQRFVWRLFKPGFAPVLLIASPPLNVQRAKLLPVGSVPPEMVVVTPGLSVLGHPLPDVPVALDEFLIDRHEVTNAEFKRFVDAGGYRTPTYWTAPFVREGHTIPWSDAVLLFRDASGRSGPSTWEGGTYRRGQAQYPVTGVSWYEAAAYAAWAGKSLPTIYHWYRAAQTNHAAVILPGSNIETDGLKPVGSPRALSGFGTTDMAGNAKEWCLNEGRGSTRYILGGSYDEPSYMFSYADDQSPWLRLPTFGFRTVKLAAPPAPALTARIDRPLVDFATRTPVRDATFRAFQALYTYDHAPLNPTIENTAAGDGWTREKVTIDAAYGSERVPVYLFKPPHAPRPVQSVIFWTGGGAYGGRTLDATDEMLARRIDFIVASGRALVIPVLRGQWERPDGLGVGGEPRGKWRDRVVMQWKDIARTIDYLQTRADFDRDRIAYFGFSAGGAMAPIILANEPRFKAAVLSSGGAWFRNPLPEADWLNFAPHVRVPVLMLNGRYDQYFPVDTSQVPFFNLLGTPPADKQHLLYDSGHGDVPQRDVVRETLAWLDKYLGPVTSR